MIWHVHLPGMDCKLIHCVDWPIAKVEDQPQMRRPRKIILDDDPCHLPDLARVEVSLAKNTVPGVGVVRVLVLPLLLVVGLAYVLTLGNGMLLEWTVSLKLVDKEVVPVWRSCIF